MQVRVAAVTQLGACAAVGALHEVALQDADSQVRRKARKAAEANFPTLPALLRPVLTPQPEPHHTLSSLRPPGATQGGGTAA